MYYSEIIDTAYSYADRSDDGTLSKADMFLKIVESRINTVLSTQNMVLTAQTAILENVYEYSFPDNYLSIKDVRLVNVADPTISVTLLHTTPGNLAKYIAASDSVDLFCVIGNTISIGRNPYSIDDAWVIEMSYYRRLVPLSNINISNWVSEKFPDVYVFGLLVEINAFVKDASATQLWEQRFKLALDQITFQDTQHLWNGPTLITRVEA